MAPSSTEPVKPRINIPKPVPKAESVLGEFVDETPSPPPAPPAAEGGSILDEFMDETPTPEPAPKPKIREIAEAPPSSGPTTPTPSDSGKAAKDEKKLKEQQEKEAKQREKDAKEKEKKEKAEREREEKQRKQEEEKAKKKQKGPKPVQAPEEDAKKDSEDEEKAPPKRTASRADLLALAKATPTDEKKTKEKEKKEKKIKVTGQVTSGGFIRAQLYDEIDVRKYWYRAIGSGFMACVSMVFIAYLISCFSDASLLARTFIFTPYSHDNVMNEFLGLWAVTFTPFSKISLMDPNWGEDALMYMLPTILGALFIALNTKHPLYAIIGTGFFAFFSLVIPFGLLMTLPALGFMDPSSVDAGLLSAFSPVIDSWGVLTTGIAQWTRSLFIGFCFSGVLEISIVMVLIAILLSSVFFVLKRMVGIKG
jgi:hypothetical protein